MVPWGMRYLSGAPKSSVKYQPLTSTALVPGLWISMLSGTSKVRVSASLINTGAKIGAGGSSSPGEPSSPLLGRQLALRVQSSGAAFSSTITSEKPRPSVIGYQELL